MSEILKIEKLVFGGQGLARAEGRTVFVWNALPGEEVMVEYIEKKKDYAEAIATKIITASPDRVTPLEDHFLSSAPWEMISWEAENRYKQEITIETYGRQGGLILQANKPELVCGTEQTGYRNKIEYSFVELPDHTISFAFFHRGGRQRLPVTDSVLAEPVINDTAHKILAWINEVKIPIRSLKALIVRSNGQGKSIAALFIKDKLEYTNYPALSPTLLGFYLYYSTHKSPASVPTALLYSIGQDYLETDILGTTLQFGLLSFFQINIPVFISALKDIAAFVSPKETLLDFYAGVGAISLPLAKNRRQTIIVESNEEACEYAEKNARNNHVENVDIHCLPAEKITDVISAEATIILDPPRAGLHDRVVRTLLTKRPPRIVYMSCNLSTQARDIGLLSENYKVVFLKLYNFFPRTPHIEGLAVLELL